MKASGTVVLLVASADTLAARLEGTAGRPLLDTDNDPAVQLATLVSERTAAYAAAADVVVDTDGRTPEEVAVAIEAACDAI
jgi:shikimate dehydrogenase